MTEQHFMILSVITDHYQRFVHIPAAEVTPSDFHKIVSIILQQSRLAIKGFLLERESHHTQQEQWDERRANKIYQHRIQEQYRSVTRPVFDGSTTNTMGKNLETAIQKLKELREKLLHRPDKSIKNGDERNDTKITKGKGQNPVTKKLPFFKKKTIDNDSTKRWY